LHGKNIRAVLPENISNKQDRARLESQGALERERKISDDVRLGNSLNKVAAGGLAKSPP